MAEVYTNIFCSSCLTMRTGKFPHNTSTLKEADRNAACCDYPLYLFISSTIVSDLDFDGEVLDGLRAKNPRLYAKMIGKG